MALGDGDLEPSRVAGLLAGELLAEVDKRKSFDLTWCDAEHLSRAIERFVNALDGNRGTCGDDVFFGGCVVGFFEAGAGGSQLLKLLID